MLEKLATHDVETVTTLFTLAGLPATRCGGPPPRSEARARRDSPDIISRFTKVRGTIPRISYASIITAFRQGVRDEKMLEKLATHDVETVTTLFTLADKCARAAEGRAWHSTPQTGVTPTGGSGATTQGGGRQSRRGSCMALSPTNRSWPVGWLGCHPPGWKEEKEEGP